MNERPLTVEVITPAYNHARYLRATLESVANQTYANIEHTVVDGGSTDGTVELLREWSRDYPLRWTSQGDGGQAAAIAAAIASSTCDVVTWLNSDDYYLDDGVISDVVALFQNGAAVVTGAGWYVSEEGGPTERIPVFPDRLTFDALRHVDWILQPATFFKREIMEKFPIDTTLTYAFDWDLFIRMSRSETITPIDREIAAYRIHGTGKTVSGASRRKRELLQVTRRYNGRGSPSYLLLRALVQGYEWAETLPRPIGPVLRKTTTGLALLSQRGPRWAGVQF